MGVEMKQLTIRLPAEMVDSLTAAAEKSRVTVNKVVTELINESIEIRQRTTLLSELKSLYVDLLSQTPAMLASGAASRLQLDQTHDLLEQIDEDITAIKNHIFAAKTI